MSGSSRHPAEAVVAAAEAIALGSGDCHAHAGTAQMSGMWEVYRDLAIRALDGAASVGYCGNQSGSPEQP